MRTGVRVLGALGISLMLFSSPAIVKSTSSSDLIIANEYIRVVQNASEDATGRFSIHTTNGNPDIEGDENQYLLFGLENPWSSYTTVWIDDTPYIFGGSTHRRAGYGQRYGTVTVAPTLRNGTLLTASEINGIKVTQTLAIVESPTTGHEDTVRIEYTLENTSDTPKKVGLRIVLDTMLGSNDGAPLRMMGQDVLYDSSFLKFEMPDYWQAFDTLTNPRVISQGTIRAPGLTPPDRIVVSNWGTLADNPWHVPLQTGRPFVREGEMELDSAVALYWNPVTLAPGETKTYATMYGLGGITRTIGDLALGLTSPTEIEAASEFTIVAYVQNTRGVIRNLDLVLEMPPGFEIIRMPSDLHRDTLEYMDTFQVAWRVKSPDRGGTGNFVVRAFVGGEQVAQVFRSITVKAPVLDVIVDLPKEIPIRDGRFDPVPVRVRISNVGDVRALGPYILLTLDGLEWSSSQTIVRRLIDLKPGESYEALWNLQPAVRVSDLVEAGITVSVQALHMDPIILYETVKVPDLERRIQLRAYPLVDFPWWRAELYAVELPEFVELLLDASYRGDVTLANISRGQLTVAGNETRGNVFSSVDKDTRHIQVVVHGDGGVRGTGPLLTFDLYGPGELHIDRLQVYTASGTILDVPLSLRTVGLDQGKEGD